MPYVSVRITKDGVTVEQKRRVVEEFTRTLVEVLGKRPEHIPVIIDEVEPENRGFAGVLTTDYRRAAEVAAAYIESVEGRRTGETLDARAFGVPRA